MRERVSGRRVVPASSQAGQAEAGAALWSDAGPVARETLGLAFAIDDLMRARVWAGRRGLSLSIQLDHSADGIRFEEVLSLTPNGRSLRYAAIWRSGNGVVVQRTGERTRSHHTLDEALAYCARLERRSRFGFWRRS